MPRDRLELFTTYRLAGLVGAAGSKIGAQDHDVKAYGQFFDQADNFNKDIRDQLHIALAGPDGRIYYWAPGSNLKKPGKDVGPTLCVKE